MSQSIRKPGHRMSRPERAVARCIPASFGDRPAPCQMRKLPRSGVSKLLAQSRRAGPCITVSE